MLRQLSIRDVVLIEALELDFEPGLGVLTGETGAGKSILLDSLGLALGARADSGLVRNGCEKSSVGAVIELPDDHPIFETLDDQGIERDGGEPLLLRRTLKADGGSRAFANGAPVNAATLREIGAAAIEIHGQHDERGLLNPKGHRALLDLYGGCYAAKVASAWEAVAALTNEYEKACQAQENAARDREWLEHASAEIAKLAPQEGEEAKLAEMRAAMQAGARATEALSGIDDLLGGSDGALSKLRQAARKIERGAADHPLLGDALAALDRALIEADEADAKINDAAHQLIIDPAKLDEAEERLFEIRALARKHRVEPDNLKAHGDELAARLADVDAGGERVKALEAKLAEARATYDAAAAALTKARKAAAERLDKAVASELAPLKLDAAKFRTDVGEAEPGPSGADRVEFLIATNPGAPFAPLIKIASGGELSRFILALKVALAEAGQAGTMIFDEIDRGVGGAVASAIGERLGRLAEKSQVLVVTHSPQVAARATTHYRIEKASDGHVTRTSVKRLDAAERLEEIARMLSGAHVTDEARAQAAKLMETA